MKQTNHIGTILGDTQRIPCTAGQLAQAVNINRQWCDRPGKYIEAHRRERSGAVVMVLRDRYQPSTQKFAHIDAIAIADPQALLIDLDGKPCSMIDQYGLRITEQR